MIIWELKVKGKVKGEGIMHGAWLVQVGLLPKRAKCSSPKKNKGKIRKQKELFIGEQ